MTPTPPLLSASDFQYPAVSLSGVVDYAMYGHFKTQVSAAPAAGLVVIELSTLGGDPEVARMMGEDVRFSSAMNPARRIVFLGKTTVYSAGVTFMSFFLKENRYLTRGTRLMVHERRLIKTLNIDGPLSTCRVDVEATLQDIRISIDIQDEGFANLAQGSSLSADDIRQRATSNWYMTALEARQSGLVQDVL